MVSGRAGAQAGTMNTTDASSPPPPSLDAPPGPARRLTRSTEDKVLTGLSGGLGRYFGVDPVIFRIAFVVLALAGGSGVLLYLLGWLMIPDDEGRGPGLERLASDRMGKLLLAVAAGIGILMLFNGDGPGWGNFPVALALIGVGVAILWSRRGPTPGGPPPEPWASPLPADSPSPADTPTSPLATGVPPSAPPSPARPSQPPSALVPVTLSVLAVLGGGLALVGAPLDVSLALALLVTSIALVIGAWRGRARWLIPIAALLAIGMGASAVVDVPVTGEIGDRRYQPATVDALRTIYRLGIGELVVDLSDVDLQGGGASVDATNGIGELRVVVPRDAEVVAYAHAGAGVVRLFGGEANGTDVGRRAVSPGVEGGGRLVVDARIGIGEVVIHRAAA
jgi:phage shock protein PspC (stress-responsive transcriptional regulator)